MGADSRLCPRRIPGAQQAIDGQSTTGWAIHGPGKWNASLARPPSPLNNRCSSPLARAGRFAWSRNMAGSIRWDVSACDWVNLSTKAAHWKNARWNIAERKFAAWLATETQRTGHWTLLQPTAAKSVVPTLEILPDGSVLASGDMSKRDEYHVSYSSPLRGALRHLRLEALPDDRFPKGGPGRIAYEGPFGDFFLSEISASLAGVKQKINAASHSFAGGGSAPAAIDGDPQTGWAINGGQGRAHHAVFRFEQPLADASALELTLLFERYYAAGLGRFRLWATTDPQPADARDLTTDVDILLLKPAAERTPDEQAKFTATFSVGGS